MLKIVTRSLLEIIRSDIANIDSCKCAAQVKVVDRNLEKKVREDVMKALDQKENEYLPQIVLDMTEVRVILMLLLNNYLPALISDFYLLIT